MISAIHGFTGSPDSWRVLDAPAPTQALTVLGHGPGAKALGTETFADEVDRLASQLPPHCEHLLGYSLGARLSLAMAIGEPERYGALTLIGVNPGLLDEAGREATIQADRSWIEILHTQGIEAFVDAWQALPLWESQQALPASRQEQQRDLRLRHDASQLALALQALGTGVMPPMWQELSRLPMPVTLVVGALDQKYLDIAEAMLTRLPRGRLIVIEEAGHNPLLERPAALRKLLADALPHKRLAQ